ncbi:hypothetical protein [Ahrensia sp. R2A130]|uniref:hypothetical protein n=1 Tax=Ahrensia sp. R2A130 TaxID=744979 RepID=UPI0001E08436|nr:hypothetical protein [Ahrensia sp. R2A130]EFL88081.1 putative signal peptide protein [Ahrensia sp. R2A130]
MTSLTVRTTKTLQAGPVFITCPAFFMRFSIALAALLLAPTLATAMDRTSVYTKLDSADCTQYAPPAVAEDEPTLEEGKLVCQGPGQMTATINVYDGRSYMSFGEDDVRERLFMSFDHPGPAMEWRLHDGVPVAMILRFKLGGLSVGGNDNVQGNVLVVHRLVSKAGSSCLVGWVDASANKAANEMAREMADAAAAFRCGTDKPHTFGERSPLIEMEAEAAGLEPL